MSFVNILSGVLKTIGNNLTYIWYLKELFKFNRMLLAI